jgi:Ca-activated chloride channel family protein
VLSLSRNRSDLVPVLCTLLVGSVLVAGARTAWPSEPCDPEEVAARSEQQLGSEAVVLSVLSSTNKAALIKEMACRFERGDPMVGSRPIDVVVSQETSGAAFEEIGKTLAPDVWLPASSSWVSMLRQEHDDWLPPPGEQPPIAQSPQVIAMPDPIATALGWPDDPLGWRDIARYAADPAAWNEAVGGADVGDFKLGKTNPRLSTSGLNATVATFEAAPGMPPMPSDITPQNVEDRHVRDFVHAVESATVHYAPTSVEFLTNLRTQDDEGNGLGYVSAILLEEKSVWDYNQGNPSGDPSTLGDATPPQTKLDAFYPSDGALVADHPFVPMRADWVDEDQRLAADQLLRFLLAPEQQDRFRSLGYRDANGRPGSAINIENGVLPVQPKVAGSPTGDVLRGIYDRWPLFRKPARVLIVFDVSGSMASKVSPDGPTKLELAKKAAFDAIRQLVDTDEVGLWTYSPADARPYVERVPIDALSSNRGALLDAIQSLAVDEGNRSELYTTATDSVTMMRDDSFDPTRINGVVLLSDGPDDGSSGVDGASAVNAMRSPADREVRVFTIAFGDQADVAFLQQVADASLGTAYDATDPTRIGKVFSQVVANF